MNKLKKWSGDQGHYSGILTRPPRISVKRKSDRNRLTAGFTEKLNLSIFIKIKAIYSIFIQKIYPRFIAYLLYNK